MIQRLWVANDQRDDWEPLNIWLERLAIAEKPRQKRSRKRQLLATNRFRTIDGIGHPGCGRMAGIVLWDRLVSISV